MPAIRPAVAFACAAAAISFAAPAPAAVTDTANITLPRAIPESLTPRPSDYPEVSINRSERGVSGILLTVDPSGRVRRCETYRSSGYERLDKRACKIASERWRFPPGTRNGQPAEIAFVSYYLWDFARNPIPASALPTLPEPHLPGQEQRQP